MKKTIVLLQMMGCFFVVQAEKLPQRTEISLNGIWSFIPENSTASQLPVPDFWDAHQAYRTVDRAMYEREVIVPGTPEWHDKIIKIEFEGVNFIADIYINEKLVSTHTGGWIPFSVDITKYIKAGESFILKVDVKGGNSEPITDDQGAPLWPVGFNGQQGKWGIVFDVWLRAYGQVNILDTYIRTSYREKTIQVDYTIKNDSRNTKQITVNSEIKPAIGRNSVSNRLISGIVELGPDEEKTISIKSTWNEAHLWSPDDPFLYYLQSSIIESTTGKSLDSEIRRFGFREIWVEGTGIFFNGHPITILGTNIVQHSEFYDSQRYFYLSPENWNTSIDRLFELNLRTVRFHMQPVPGYILDMADERGLLVMDESAIYAREYMLKSDKEKYMHNCMIWIEAWIKDRRNHPSIIIWNAENEMGVGWINWMNASEIKSLGNTIRLYDTTRPVNYDGDYDVDDQLINYHYPEGYMDSVYGSIYSWNELDTSRPTGVGEFLTHYGDNGTANQWWQGTWVRGMRYLNYDDIRPYRHDWAWLRSDNTPCIENLKNGYSPVALFDKEYDDLGIDPLFHGNYPLLMAGDTANRTLILYNNEFSDTVITIEVLVKSSEIYQAVFNYTGNRTPVQRVVAKGSGTYIVPLGEHIDIPFAFQVPALYEGFADCFDVELIARKKGEIKFRETKRFALRTHGFSGETSKKVWLSEAQNPDY